MKVPPGDGVPSPPPMKAPGPKLPPMKAGLKACGAPPVMNQHSLGIPERQLFVHLPSEPGGFFDQARTLHYRTTGGIWFLTNPVFQTGQRGPTGMQMEFIDHHARFAPARLVAQDFISCPANVDFREGRKRAKQMTEGFGISFPEKVKGERVWAVVDSLSLQSRGNPRWGEGGAQRPRPGDR